MTMAGNEPETDNTQPMEVDANDDEDRENEGGIRIGDIYIPPPPLPTLTFDCTGPRLIITHISNENFKSYAGKQVLGPFHKSFTSIVGPNGSGKSNVIDSMLFVFGYRAQKIRSKKISTLIHNSEQHKNVDSASVSVHFQKIIDKADDFEIVPNSQFVITRTVYKDNSSWYSINGRRTQFKEVAQYLRDHGIDLDYNRFLILQGEVEQIAMMKPKAQTEHDTGMLEFLEDIIGSARFKEPLEKLIKRVEELNEQRNEKFNRVKVVEKEKDELEGPKNEALEYITLENDIAKIFNLYYQCNIHITQLHCEKAQADKQEIEDGSVELLNKVKELKESKKRKEKEFKKMQNECEKEAGVADEKKKQFTEFEKQDVQCRENIKHTDQKYKKIKKDLEQEKKKLEDIKTLPSRVEEELEELDERKKGLEREKAQEEEKNKVIMAGLKKETVGLQGEKDKLEAQLMGLKKDVNASKSKLDIARSEMDLYLSGQQKEQSRLQEMQKNFEAGNNTVKERKKAITELEKSIPELERKLNCEAELTRLKAEEAQKSEELRACRVKLEEARNNLQATSSRSRVLDSLLQQKDKGKLPGIFGRLGDLGAIDEKYDIAISTACGSLDNIVTDTIDTAQKCVEFLKKNNIGSSTFIALDKMDRWKEYVHKKINTPENVPRLYDLVRVNDEKILPAFYYALRDTLVAKDLDQATRIAFKGSKRYRVVTLQGGLIDTSGTMSGGGGKVSKGRMGRSVTTAEFTPAQVEQMERDQQKLAHECTQLRNKCIEIEEVVVVTKKKLDEGRYNLQKYQIEIESLEQQVVSLQAQIKEQQVKVKDAAPDKQRLAEMQKRVDEFNDTFTKANQASLHVEAQVQTVHTKIMEITGGKMKAAQKKLDELNKKIDSADNAITKAKAAAKNAGRNMKKCEDKIANIENEIQENRKNEAELQQQLKELESQANSVLQELNAAIDRKKELEDQFSNVKKEVNKFQADEAKLNEEHLEVKHKLEGLEDKVKDAIAKVNHWKKLLSKLVLQEVDGKPLEELQNFQTEELEKESSEKLKYQLAAEEEKLKQMKPNLAAIADYKKKEQHYLERVKELDDITGQRDSQQQLYDNIRRQRLNEFMTGFSIITNKLQEMYQMITLGGDAELELVDTLDPFSEGIVFSVRPPKKSWKSISNLSGGEKTLSSLALVFALHYYKPTPFYVMDEIDAALDFKNVSIVGNYIKERTKNAQFIIISLRNNMFELADRLVGIYKTYNCTKSVSINPGLICKPEP